MVAGDVDQQRQVLEQTRNYLISLQQELAVEPRDLSIGQFNYQSLPAQEQSAAESAQQVLQAVLQEMNFLRSQVLHPLRNDVEALQQQRESLIQEIRLLEAQHQQYALPPQQINQQQLITEFLQSLMERLQENLTGQVTQMLAHLDTPSAEGRSLLEAAANSDTSGSLQPMLSPQQRLEQFQMLQLQSDQLLLRLDTTLRVIFDSLQNNIQGYQDSLSQGLDKMHNLGQQGEAMFSALVNRLAQQLGREASTYLQSSIQAMRDANHPPLPATAVPTSEPQDEIESPFSFDHIPPSTSLTEAGTALDPIDQLLQELETKEPTTVIQPSEPAQTEAIASSPLDLANVELSSLETDPHQTTAQADLADLDDDLTFLQIDPLPTLKPEQTHDEELTFFQIDEELTRLQTDLETVPIDSIEGEPDLSDIDSALNLLNQLSEALETDNSMQTDHSTSTIDSRVSETAAAPNPLDSEMSELYQSLFGSDSVTTSSPEDVTAILPPPPIDRHVADASLLTQEPQELEIGEVAGKDEAIAPAVEPMPEMATAIVTDELFEGLTDPAQVEPALTDLINSDNLDTLSTDSAESLLEFFGEFASDVDELDNPFATAPDTLVEGDIETITRLTDLIQANDEAPQLADAESVASFSEALYQDAQAQDHDQDRFVPASPDEVLIVSEESEVAPRPEIRLDMDTLNQLRADLSSLEGLDDEQFAFPEMDLAESKGGGAIAPASDIHIDTHATEHPLEATNEITDNEVTDPDEATDLEPAPEPLADQPLTTTAAVAIEQPSLEEDWDELFPEPQDRAEATAHEPATLFESEPVIEDLFSFDDDSLADESTPNLQDLLDDLTSSASTSSDESSLTPTRTSADTPTLAVDLFASEETSPLELPDELQNLLLDSSELSSAPEMTLEELGDDFFATETSTSSDSLSIEGLFADDETEPVAGSATDLPPLELDSNAALLESTEEISSLESLFAEARLDHSPDDEEQTAAEIDDLPLTEHLSLLEDPQPSAEPATTELPETVINTFATTTDDLTNVVPASAALHAHDGNAPLLSIPADENLLDTEPLDAELLDAEPLDAELLDAEPLNENFLDVELEDLLFSGDVDELDADGLADLLDEDSLVTVDSDLSSTKATPAGAANDFDTTSVEHVLEDEAANAFTLEGLLGSLFEDSPNSAIAPLASTSSQVADSSNVAENSEKKNILNSASELPATDSPVTLEDRSTADLNSALTDWPEVSEDIGSLANLDLENWPDTEGDRLTDSTSTMFEISEELGIDPQELESLLESHFGAEELFTPPTTPPVPPTAPKVWYLGLDFGTTGLSAVLLNRSTSELYPIYWLSLSPHSPAEQSTSEQLFRLPTRVYLSPNDRALEATDHPGFVPPGNLVKVSFISSNPDKTAARSTSGESEADPTDNEFLIHDFKPYLKVGIPYFSPETSCWEPIFQWSEHHQISLSPIHQALRVLLTTLSNSPATLSATAIPTCAAIGLENGVFQDALQQLAGVIVGFPVHWPDTYAFNIREAILGAQLVSRPDQIVFIEDVVATVLSGLRSADGRAIALPTELAQNPHLHNADWHGPTLVINSGATVTDLALVNLPSQLQHLTYQDFYLRSLAYAGNALDQDIISQLIYPAWSRSASSATTDSHSGDSVSMTDALRSNGNGKPTDQASLEGLGLANLSLPVPGELDTQNRLLLQQRLESSALGQSLLEATRHLKLTLQHQDRCTLEIGQESLIVTRQDLSSRVFLPFMQRLNRELNTLLAQANTSTLAVQQVICTGGTASLGAIARWLREKFPNATIIQDTYANNRTLSPRENCLPTCSRVAYGLATLPLHPTVLNLGRQQYSDYFLLLELLRAFPDEPLSVGGVMHLLERRGINTQSCYTSVLALLEGHLPPGLVPTERDAALLTPESQQNPDYQVLLSAPLFHKQNNQTYLPNYEQWNHFRRYLSTVLTSTYQKLTEPLSVSIAIQQES
jgi:hypothetical protein